MKREHNLHESFYFQWLQLIDSIPQRWKITIKENYENATNLTTDDHHLVKGSRIITLDKLTSTEIYSMLISRAQNKPSSNISLPLKEITLTNSKKTIAFTRKWQIINNIVP